MYQERIDSETILKCPEEVWLTILRMLDKDPSTRITIPEILSGRIMRKVVTSVINKHKPANLNARQIR